MQQEAGQLQQTEADGSLQAWLVKQQPVVEKGSTVDKRHQAEVHAVRAVADSRSVEVACSTGMMEGTLHTLAAVAEAAEVEDVQPKTAAAQRDRTTDACARDGCDPTPAPARRMQTRTSASWAAD